MWATIEAIEYYLPETVLSNEELAAQSDEWTAEKIRANSGIDERRIVAPGECASDLAVAAANKLFASGRCSPDDIDYLLVCTQSPDYFLPSTACIVQERLGLPTAVGALDFNLGCSGFVYGLGLAKGLIESGQARNVLLITSETVSRYLRPDDLAVRILFGDGAAATLVRGVEECQSTSPPIGAFTYGTDGSGAEHLMVRNGAMRALANSSRCADPAAPSDTGPTTAFMNGPEIFAFTLREVPKLVRNVLESSGIELDEVRWFVFHQANQFILDHLQKKLHIPREKFCIAMSHCGNTISSTVPIGLKELTDQSKLRLNDPILVIGFGVGLSWAGTMLRWTGAVRPVEESLRGTSSQRRTVEMSCSP